MAQERIFLINPNKDNYSESIKTGFSMLETYKAQNLLTKAQDELWLCGQIIAIIDDESQSAAYQLQTQITRNTVGGFGCSRTESTEWVRISSDGKNLIITSDRQSTQPTIINPQEISSEQIQENIYKKIKEDSSQRSFGTAFNEKMCVARASYYNQSPLPRLWPQDDSPSDEPRGLDIPLK